MDTLTIHISSAARAALRTYMMAKARILGKRFFCTALAGGSDVNVCINSDMTLSCTCHDVDGSGHIADLRRQSLEEAFSTGKAQQFREELAAGRLPTPLCTRCCDLKMIDRDKAEEAAQRFSMPKYIMVENTSACRLSQTYHAERGQFNGLLDSGVPQAAVKRLKCRSPQDRSQ